MAEDNLTLMIEANRRGLLPPDQKATFDEAVRRGLMPSSASGMDRFMMGVTDPARGIMEIAEQIIGKPEAKPVPTDPNATPKDVKVGSEVISPTDPMRIAGNVANPANLIPPLALSRVAGMGPMAKTVASATIPALMQPVGETDQFWTEKGKQGATGAALGYGFSVAGKGVSKGMDALGRWLVSRYPDNIMSNAVSLVLKRIEQDTKAGGMTAKNMLDLMRAASAEGRPLTLADVGGKNVERLAGSVYRRGGEGAATAEQLFETRDQAAANRLRQNIAQYIHGGMTVFEATEALLTARSAAARPLYEHTDSLQGIWSPRLAEFFKDPVIKQGMTRGYEIERMVSLAENRMFNPTAMGVDISDPNNIVFLRAPNMRVLDMAKQGLDSMIADERNEITGRLSARGVALDKLRRGYLSTIDTLDTTGVYRKARAEWGGYSASLDALKAGRAVFAASPEENAAFVASLKQGSGDIEFYRMGVADVLNEKIAKTGFSADEAKALIKNDWMRRQLKPAFLSEADFNSFVESVSQESQMFARRRSITGGSQTAERTLEDQSPDFAHAEAGVKVAGAFAKGNPLTAVKELYRWYRDVRTLPDPKLNEATAKILFSPLMPKSRSPISNAIRSLDTKNPPKNPVPLVGNRGNYLAGPARSVQDLLAPVLASETGEMSGGRPLPLPRYAEGGDAPAGQPIVVGERGPEVIVPKDDVSVIPDLDTLLRQMGSGPAPPPAEPMTRALPGYEQRDPGELAMIRTQESTRPTRGRADITPEHAAQMLVGGASLYAAPETLTARAIAAAPRTMTALLSTLGLIAPTSAGPSEPDLSTVEGIKEFQREAKKQGIYAGNIDGQMGPQTIEAKKAFDAAKAKAAEEAQKKRELELREKEAAAKERETALGEKKLEEKKSGQEELRKTEEQLPTWRRILRNYGPQVGYLAGVLAGGGAKSLAVRSSNKAVREAESLIKPGAPLEERVAGVNEFWRKGGASTVPFKSSDRAASKFTANQKTTNLSNLYPPNPWKGWGADAGWVGAFGAEAGAGHLMKPSAEQMSAAYKAVNDDPTTSNIERLQALKEQDAWAEFLFNMGRTAVPAYLGHGLLERRQLRPSMQGAEAERFRIEDILRGARSTKKASAKKSRTKKKAEE